MEAKPRKRAPRKKKAPEVRGLNASELSHGHAPADVIELAMQIEGQGGSVLATYRDPLGGHWQLLAGLPIELVAPTPYQRDLSETHLKRLANAIDQLGRFLDPVIAVRAPDGTYWTPNGNHRLAALKALGVRSIVALVIPDPQVAHRILVLNTEKAHNVRERALEVIRLAEGLADLDPRPEKEFLVEFEEPALLTLGLCYQQNGRFAGGVYHPVLKRIDTFLDDKLPRALERRRKRAERLLKLDEVVGEAVAALKEKGFESPYLKAFVVARINPLRFKRGARAEFDATIEGMTASARKFEVDKIKASQVARAGGAPEEG